MDTPSADLIAAHRAWMDARAMSPRTVADACELLARVDAALAGAQGAGAPGLAGALPEELVAWLANSRWSAQTRATYRGHLVRFYRWATDPTDPWLTSDPSRRLARPRVHKPVPAPASELEVVRALTATGWPWRLHCLLAAKVGMRPIEIAAAQRDHFTPTHVRIPHGKGDKPAVLPLDPEVWEVVAPMPAGPLTRKHDGSPATAIWVSTRTAAHLRALGIHTSLRHLRHWYATWLLDHGATMREVQELMRHSSIETTAGYTAVSRDRLRVAVGSLPRFGVGGVAGVSQPVG